jgi:lipid-binding SYLF domain-containing protein
MSIRTATVLAFACATLVLGTGQPAFAQADEAKVITDAAAVFNEIMGAPDKAIPNAILDKAAAIAVFPGVIRAGFIFGGQHGHGIISARDAKTGTWSAPAFMTITGGSWGLQAGGQAIDLVLVIMNERGLNNLLGNQFKIGGEASAAAGPVGRAAEASTDVQLRAEILSYSRSRGLFAGLAVNGSSLHADKDANKRFYGTDLTTKQVIIERQGGSPAAIGAWRDTLAKYTK